MYAQMSNWIRFTQNYLNQHNATEVRIKSCERMKERLFADCCEIFRKRVKETDKNAAGDLIYKYWKDLSVSEALWIKHTGYSQLHFEQQSKNPPQTSLISSSLNSFKGITSSTELFLPLLENSLQVELKSGYLKIFSLVLAHS